jgi:hypothetical protein
LPLFRMVHRKDLCERRRWKASPGEAIDAPATESPRRRTGVSTSLIHHTRGNR